MKDLRHPLMLLSLVFGLAFGQSTTVSRTRQRELKRVLLTQGFSGLTSDDVEFYHLGVLRCGRRLYDAYLYGWTQKHSPGLTKHAQMRIIFFSGKDTYLGSYAIQDVPIHVGPHAFEFAYSAHLGNKIACHEGQLPANTVLNGEVSSFFK